MVRRAAKKIIIKIIKSRCHAIHRARYLGNFHLLVVLRLGGSMGPGGPADSGNSGGQANVARPPNRLSLGKYHNLFTPLEICK